MASKQKWLVQWYYPPTPPLRDRVYLTEATARRAYDRHVAAGAEAGLLREHSRICGLPTWEQIDRTPGRHAWRWVPAKGQYIPLRKEG